MPTILDHTREYGTRGLTGKRGKDEFIFDVPAGKEFESANLTLLDVSGSAGAAIDSMPSTGATGSQKVTVGWWYNRQSSVKFRLQVDVRNPGAPPREVRVCRFLPSTHGFDFNNQFAAIPQRRFTIPGLELLGSIGIGDASNGLCGGMVYAVMDYFHAGMQIPANTNPPNSGRLYDYIVTRLYDSFGLDKPTPAMPVARYMSLMATNLRDGDNPNTGAHGRGWIMVREEWPAIKDDLDNQRLSPLGLICVKSNDPRKLGQNHQVMAYGYRIGGSLVTLFIYDPDRSNSDGITLAFSTHNPTAAVTAFYNDGQDKIRDVYCFFRTSYFPRIPPAPDGQQGRMILFRDKDFRGAYREVDSSEGDLRASGFNDAASSMAILYGRWQFFENIAFDKPFLHRGNPVVMGPGLYPDLDARGIANDALSSLKAVAENTPLNHK